jgi:hypothetical protein
VFFEARVDRPDNAQAELLVCLSFYSILTDCVANETESRAAAEAAMGRVGKMLMKASEAAHLRPSDVQLRLDLDLLDQAPENTGDYSNYF